MLAGVRAARSPRFQRLCYSPATIPYHSKQVKHRRPDRACIVSYLLHQIPYLVFPGTAATYSEYVQPLRRASRGKQRLAT